MAPPPHWVGPGGSFGARAKSGTMVESEVEVASPKQAVLEMIHRLPEDASLEDIQYHLFVLQKVERGLNDAEAGRVVSQDEVEKRLQKWLGR